MHLSRISLGLITAFTIAACDPCCQIRTLECAADIDCIEGEVCNTECGGCVPDEADGE